MVLSTHSVADTCPGAELKLRLFIRINGRFQKSEEHGN